jgi:DNA-binding transcriptional MerR regulator
MVIEQISQMRQKGMQTGDIIQNLKQQGISPREINEALSQSEIKSEITNTQGVFPGAPQSPQGMQQQPLSQPASPQMNQAATPQTPPQMGQSSSQQVPSNEQMQPSIGQMAESQPGQVQSQMNPQSQMPQGMDMQMSQPAALEPTTQDYSQYQEYAPEGDQGYYPEYSGGGGGGGNADIETINDISSQLIDEKTKHFKKEFSEFTGFKKDSQSKLEMLDKRLTKIEDHIEELKIAIIRKIGDYGEDINRLANEMQATKDSFGKIIQPLTQRAKEVKASQTSENKAKDSKTNGSDSFENYVR